MNSKPDNIEKRLEELEEKVAYLEEDLLNREFEKENITEET